ncbi:hypothetical protein COOONC_19166, partial [Cooperia oncophora]
LNIYYEKLFIFLWFWLLFVAIVSTSNTIYWVGSLCVSTKVSIFSFFTFHLTLKNHCFLWKNSIQWERARRIVAMYLATDPNSQSSRLSTEKFFKLLGPDGLFVLQQMALNLGDIPASYLSIAMRNVGERWMEEDQDHNLIVDEKLSLKNYKAV